MMRVAIVNPYATAYGYSGPNVLMDRLFSGLSKECSFTLVCGDPYAGRARDWVASVNVPAKFEKMRTLSQLTWLFAAMFWSLRHSSKFDVIHVHGGYLFNLLAVLPCAMLGRPFVILPLAGSGDLAVDSRSSRFYFARMLRRYIISKAAGGMALAPSISQELLYWGMDPSRVHLLGNIADSKCFESTPSWVNRQIVFVGTICSRKRPGLLLEALAMVRGRGHDATAVFVGPFADTAFERDFENAVDELGIRNYVTTLGFQEDVVSATAGSTLFVLASSQEGLPGALVEAMAMGLPSVVTDVGAMGEVVNAARCGAVIKPNSLELADSLDELLTSEHLWSEMSRRARSYAGTHFSSDSVTASYLKIIAEVCS